MTPPAPSPIPIQVLLDRALVGTLAAMVVARPLVAGDDPGRLRLTDGGGPVSFNLVVLLLVIVAAIWRAAYTRNRPGGWAVVPLLLAGMGVVSFISARMGDRYARPGVFIAWEWIVLAAVVYLTQRVAASASDSRGLLNVFLASAVSVAGLGVYQALTDPLGLPPLDAVVPASPDPLAGDDEFYPSLNRPATNSSATRGTLDSPETLLIFLLLALPLGIVAAQAGRGVKRGRWVILVPTFLAAGIGVSLLAKPFGEPGHWSTAVQLLERFPAFGVGPGNFSRFAPAVGSSHSAWFDLAATTGLIGIGLFVAAVAVAVRTARPTTTPEALSAPSSPRWEFQLGGAAGLVLGFVWAFGELPAEAPAREVFSFGAQAVFRAVLWFAAFAALEVARPSTRALVRAIQVGVGMVLVLGFLSEAPGRPTLLFPMFVLLTIAANLTRPVQPRPDGPWTKPVRVVGVMLAALLALGYLVTACLPAWATASGVRQARMASRFFPDKHRAFEQAKPGPARANALTASRNFLLGNMIIPLQDAAGRDPANASLWLEVARWRRPLWEYDLIADPQAAARGADETRKAAERAGQLDPHNRAWQRNLFEALLLFRRNSTVKQPERIAALNKMVAQIAEHEPEAEVPLRYRMVKLLLDRGEADGVEAELLILLGLNRVEGSPHGALTPEQKGDVIERAMKVIRKPPPELLEEWVK